MSQKTGIEWTDATWNPIRGCTRVSEGCRNCYAMKFASRFPWGANVARGGQWTGVVELVESALTEPLHWRKPRRIFVNSMSDLFHEAVAFPVIAAIYGVMQASPCQTFQVLTKRPERAAEFYSWLSERGGLGPYIRSAEGRDALRCFFAHPASARTEVVNGHPVRARGDAWMDVLNAAACNMADAPLPNVWLGVSVEDQATADERIPLLLDTPAAVRFVSAEPLLGPVDFSEVVCLDGDHLAPNHGFFNYGADAGLDQVIVGGESGPHARPCDVAWVRSIVEQCRDAGVACFVKQLGQFVVDRRAESWFEWRSRGATRIDRGPEDGRVILRSRKGGDPSEWPEDLRVREFPEAR